MYGQKFLRGQIWWVGSKNTNNDGCIQSNNRPHLIIGNNIGNRNSPILLMVPCTTEDKKPMPTHVELEVNGKKNTILCEQIKTVDINEITNYLFTLSDETMEEVNKALKVSIGLEEQEELIPYFNKNSEPYLDKDLFPTIRFSGLNLVRYSEEEKPIAEFETNKRGRIWGKETKKEFTEYYEKYGEVETSKKYNTKGNTKIYYKRFKDSLKEDNSNEKCN